MGQLWFSDGLVMFSGLGKNSICIFKTSEAPNLFGGPKRAMLFFPVGFWMQEPPEVGQHGSSANSASVRWTWLSRGLHDRGFPVPLVQERHF